METPNTRSRAKREAEACTPEDVGSIAWMHDQGLRQAVIAATMNDYMEPPTPTQKPRPITSRPIHCNDQSSSSSAPPRKRRCRPHHSLPQTLTTSSFGSTGTNPNNRAGPSSAPAGGPSSSRLDELLGEAMAAFAIKPSELVQTPSRSYQTNHTPMRRPNHTPVTLPSSSSVLQVSSNENRLSSSTADAGSSSKMRPKPSSKPSEVDTNQSSRRSVSSVSPTKPGAAPRIGLRHNQRPPGPNQRPLKPSGSMEIRAAQPTHRQNTTSVSFNDSRPPSRPGQKTFKPPLITAQPIRSSPRRHTNLPDASYSAHNGIFNPAVNTSSPTLPVRKQAAKARAAPSSDGLDADDSFDGIFQGGGPEVEMLLRTVDGSQ